MKLNDIVSKNGFKYLDFYNYLKNSKYAYKDTVFNGIVLDDKDAEELVKEYKINLANKKAEEARVALMISEQEEIKKEALANMLITSGFSFDGYTITKYSGYISGDDVISIDRGTGGLFSNPTNVGEKLMESLTVIRRNALNELKEAAYALGCNAVIGVDYDYLTLDPETASATGGTLYLPYIFGVTANGNAVVIEKNKD